MITLDGYCLEAYYSTLTRFRDGWEVRLQFRRHVHLGVVKVQGLTMGEVIPTMKRELEGKHIAEEVHEAEISKYLADQEKRFSPEATAAVIKQDMERRRGKVC